ncbi:MAG: MFS transporter [Ferruginibacter sp.]|nr:MFS transporter [Bacteroidota bacterium]MBX2919992.1 MFS transporter [Ferruginibacter sp.]MCB0710106.1 MFS transporter [Chitinophagaceae bacterium]
MISKTLTKEFRHFIFSRLFFVLGLRMITTIVIYQVFHLASTYMVGFAGLAEFVPAVIAALFAGHYIDRHNKKNILVWSYAFYTLCGLMLAIISLPYFQFSNSTKLSVILSVVFCTGIIRSFAGPAANSMIAAIVPREELQNAISYNSSTWLISSIGGHAIGGLLIAILGISGAYFVTATLVLIAGIFALQLLPKPPVNVKANDPMITSIKKGFSFVYHNKNLLGVISLDLFAVLFGGAVAFIPEVASTVLHTGAIGYGFLNAAMDIGSLISVGILVRYPMKQKQGLKMLMAVACFGLCIIIFGLSKVYWLSFMALLVAGLCDAVSVVVRGTILQLFTPDELRGRVASINLIFINSSNELGQFESGVTSRMLGTVPAIIFGGAMSVLVVAGTWIKFPQLKKLEY